MKGFYRLTLFAIATVMFFAACGNKNKFEESPSEVALKLYNGLTSGDVETVTENIFFEDSLDYNLFRDYFKMAVTSEDYKKRTEGYKPEYEVKSEDIDGDVAIVKLEGIGPLGNMLKIDVRLVAVGNRWKVDGNHGVFHSDF